MLIDSHAHLSSSVFDEKIADIVARAKAEGLQAIVNICTSPQEISRGLFLREKFPIIFNAAATTPHDAEKQGELYFETFAKHAREGHLIAIGETGLDYYHYASTQDIQKKIFIRYLELAKECRLPIIVHCRDAFSDFFQIIDQHYVSNQKYASGVLHCFTGTIEEAEQLIQRGWYLSLSGIVTFPKSQELQKVAQWVPLDHLLIETDAPYLAPQKHRGMLNEPSFLKETASFIAHLKNITLEELMASTSQNSCKLFSISNLG